MEVGIPYILTGPDGTRAVFNDSSDPDFVGYLDPDSGITGLLDTADVRVTKNNIVEGDGMQQGNNYLAAKTGTIQGVIYPTSSDLMGLFEQKIKRAARGLRVVGAADGSLPVGPAALTWTPSVDGIQRLINCYREGKVAVTNRRPKQFQIPLGTPDPYIFSAALQSMTLTPSGGTVGDQGAPEPWTENFSTVYSPTAQQFILNAGDSPAWPIFTIKGPITNPQLFNNSYGFGWRLTYNLLSTDTIVVDAGLRTVMLNGTGNRYSAYAANFASNRWWPLMPKNNDVRLFADAYGAGAQVTVQWRHSWE